MQFHKTVCNWLLRCFMTSCASLLFSTIKRINKVNSWIRSICICSQLLFIEIKYTFPFFSLAVPTVTCHNSSFIWILPCPEHPPLSPYPAACPPSFSFIISNPCNLTSAHRVLVFPFSFLLIRSKPHGSKMHQVYYAHYLTPGAPWGFRMKQMLHTGYVVIHYIYVEAYKSHSVLADSLNSLAVLVFFS